MVEKKVQIGLESGLKERPIAVLVQKASQFDSSVYLKSGNKTVNAKSIMGVMGMGLKSGDYVSVTAEGSDEEMAATEIVKHLEN